MLNEDTDAKRRYARLTPATWAEIRALWETGERTLAQLSEEYGVTTRAIQMHFQAHGTVKGAAAHALAADVEAEVFAASLLDRDSLVERAQDIRETAYNNAVKLEAMLLARLDTASRDASATFATAAAVKMIGVAAQALERLHQLKKNALGLKDDDSLDDELPTLEIADLTHEDIAAMRAAQAEEDADLTISHAVRRDQASDIIVEAA